MRVDLAVAVATTPCTMSRGFATTTLPCPSSPHSPASPLPPLSVPIETLEVALLPRAHGEALPVPTVPLFRPAGSCPWAALIRCSQWCVFSPWGC